MYKISPEDIYTKTDGGLQIILDYYPTAAEDLEGKKGFKMRDEKTSSAHLKKFGDIWKVTDFGGEGRALGAIDICMERENITFTEALYFLAARYGVNYNLSEEINKPVISKRAATTEEEEGQTTFKCKEAISDEELLILAPRKGDGHIEQVRRVCKKYSYFSLESLTIIKNRVAYTITATENYPIFLRDCGEFQKVYQPLSFEKKNRFRYIGKKSKDFINGLKELQKIYADMNSDPEDPKETKVPEVFFCSGERDALCCAALGYVPLWLNSETSDLSESAYYSIKKLTERIYNIPDIDDTGVKVGISMATKFLDLYTVWLPEFITKYKDLRGRSRKDFRDFVELRPEKKHFDDLLTQARPMQFWEYATDDKGRKKLTINPEFLCYFLRLSGFGTIEDKTETGGKAFIRITENNKVSKVTQDDIRAFLLYFVKSRFLDVSVINLIHTSTRIKDTVLVSVGKRELNFTDYARDHQLFFFQNEIWKITGEGVNKVSDASNYVWDADVIRHKVKRLPASFGITIDQDAGLYDIDIKRINSNYFKFLINTSRLHWRHELEQEVPKMATIEEQEKYREVHHFDINGPLLTEQERREQRQSLINKIFSIGYLMHRYKDPSRTWAVYAIDNKVDTMENSNGGSGKSFCYNMLKNIMSVVSLPGKKQDLFKDTHVLGNINEFIDLIMLDDAESTFKMEQIFDIITGSTPVNPKFSQAFSIEYKKSPKWVITTNYPQRQNDSSTERRLLYSVFSDYYHVSTMSNEYKDTITIFSDFGKTICDDDYTEEEWNEDLNFLADCCRFYLSTTSKAIKIQPPMRNVVLRTLIAQMGEGFLNWAQVFFAPGGETLDKLISREIAFTSFVETSKLRNTTMNFFSKALRAYCQYADYIIELNPKQLHNSQGRIIRRNDDGKPTDHIYVRTKEEISVDITDIDTDYIPEDEKPF